MIEEQVESCVMDQKQKIRESEQTITTGATGVRGVPRPCIGSFSRSTELTKTVMLIVIL